MTTTTSAEDVAWDLEPLVEPGEESDTDAIWDARIQKSLFTIVKERLDDKPGLNPAPVLEREPAGSAEPAVAAGDAQCRVDPTSRRAGREQALEPYPAQLVRLIPPGRLGRTGPAGDDAMPVEQEEAGEDRHVGLVLVGRFGSGRHRSTAIKRRARRNRSMWRAARCINRR